MPPLPGDPHPSRQSDIDGLNLSHPGVHDSLETSQGDDHPFNVILRMNDFNEGDRRVHDAVLYCKAQADFLKLSGYPLYGNHPNFDAQVRKTAQDFNVFLDKLITLPGIRTDALFSKLRVLLAQGESYETFKNTMNELDVSLKCNTIWENDSVAYRCNTCALTPCMSLCASCFQAANHEGHDFTRFFSREGGACDCGNSDVIRPIGFCPRHGENAVRPPPPSPLIVSLPRHIFQKLLVCLFLEWRGFKDLYTQERDAMEWEEPFNLAGFCDNLVTPMQLLINFLQECVNYGGPMREAMAEILMDKDLYRELTKRNSDEVDPTAPADMSLDWRTRQMFHSDRMSIFSESLFSCFPELDAERLLECECLLDELLFWVIRMNFPQNLINFSLSMLSEPNYTDALSIRFFTWYPLVANCVRRLCVYSNLRERTQDIVQSTCSRLIHISVQMLSSEALCKRLNEKCDLVKVVLNTACYMLTEYLQKTEMTLDPFFVWCTSAKQLEGNESEWEVMLMEKNATMTQHGYWFVMGDIQNLLAHPSLAISTVLHPTAFSDTYTTLLNRMQGMNVNWRIVRGEHRENDNTELVQRSFTLEFEALALTMFNFITAISQKEHYVAAVAFFDKIVVGLKNWIQAISGWCTGDIIECPKYCVSFHLPLHRHLSTALSHFNDMELFRRHVEDFRKDEPLLRRIVLHPLKIQVARAEYYAGMWVRNGNQLRVQAIIYAQPHINVSFQTPDIDLIRYCGANVDPDWFIDVLLRNFHLSDIFAFPPREENLADEDKMEIDQPDTSESAEKSGTVGTGRATPDEVADANWERCAEQIKVILKDLPPGKADVVMAALHARSGDNLAFSRVNPPLKYSEENPENLPSLAYVFNEDKANVITRMEWVDPMISSMLRLLSELVVLLTNCGASTEASLRAEMVNTLASAPQTHSRLRSVIAEKGSRGAEVVDPLFEKVLNEIADFTEPIAVPGGQMRQGSYQLKSDVRFNEFCPVLCQHRALSPKSSATTLMDVEKMERDLLGSDEKIAQIWIPYQLSDFSDKTRHESVRHIARVLLSDRFVQLSIVVLEAGILGRPEIRETTTQLVIYLLSLAYQYMATLPPSEKYAAITRFRKSYVATEGLKVVQLPLLVFVLFIIECEKRAVKAKFLERTMAGDFDRKRIVGGAAEYLGRLVSLISKCDDGIQLSLLSALDDCTKEKEVELRLDGSDQKAVQERKAAAKRRREALFAANKKKNSEVMKRLMEKEGMTQKDIDSIDTTQPDVRLYECPICGELDTPSTLRNPLGLLVRITSNPLCENQVPASENDNSLLSFDNKSGEVVLRNFSRTWRSGRSELFRRTLFYSDLIGFSTSLELKTCGHTVHMKCFNAYRETLRNDLRVNDSRRSSRDVSCFLCRYSVNALLPLRIDWGYETTHKDTLADDRQKAFDSLKEVVMNWRRVPQTSEESRPYSEHFTEHMLELLNSRFWSKVHEEDDVGTRVQTRLVALIKATVERCVLLKKLNVPERRKGTRAAITEHLVAAAVCRTSRRDEEVSMCAVRDLLLPNIQESSEVLASHSKEPFSISDELIDVAEIRENLLALRSTSEIERSRQYGDAAKTPVLHFLDKPSSIPLILFELKSLLVRLSAYVVDNQHLSNEDKKKLCQLLARRILAVVVVKTFLRVLLRSSKATLDSFASGKFTKEGLCGPFSDVPRLIVSHLSANTAYFNDLLNVMHHDGWQEEKGISAVLDWTLTDFAIFVAEFWQHVGILNKSNADYAGMSLDDALKNLGINQQSIVPEEEYVNAWVRRFSPFLIWNYDTSRKAFSMEPLMWRPFLLLDLPEEYDVLFSRYFQRQCINCNKAPLFPFVCLLCSTLVCLDTCCSISDVGHERSLPTNEVERHSLECGGDACCFIALNSSLIVIVREGLAAVWGSVYLDAHGEEDRNLRRGKPLFLSARRVDCLRSDWAEQEFERTGATWSTMAGLQQILKDAHLFR